MHTYSFSCPTQTFGTVNVSFKLENDRASRKDTPFNAIEIASNGHFFESKYVVATFGVYSVRQFAGGAGNNTDSLAAFKGDKITDTQQLLQALDQVEKQFTYSRDSAIATYERLSLQFGIAKAAQFETEKGSIAHAEAATRAGEIHNTIVRYCGHDQINTYENKLWLVGQAIGLTYEKTKGGVGATVN